MKKGFIFGVVTWILLVIVSCANNPTTTISTTTSTPTSSQSTTSGITVTSYIEDYKNPDLHIDPSKIVSVETRYKTDIHEQITTINVITSTVWTDLTDDEYYSLVYPHFYDPNVCGCKWY